MHVIALIRVKVFMLMSCVCVNTMPSSLEIVYPQERVLFTDSDDSEYTVTVIDPNTGYVESTKFPSKAEAEQQITSYEQQIIYGSPVDLSPISPPDDGYIDGAFGAASAQNYPADPAITGSANNEVEDFVRTSLSRLVQISVNESDYRQKVGEYLDCLTDPSIV